MFTFYFLSLIPIIIGAILWIFTKKVVLWEWICGTIAAFILSGIFHFIAFKGQTDDKEVWSGQIISERQFSEWKEYYEYAVYRTETTTTTNSDGTTSTTSYQVFDHWEPTTRIHNIHWVAYSDINSEYEINHNHFLDLEAKFKHSYKVEGKRKTSEHNSRMIGGDPFDYISENRSNQGGQPRYIEPITETKTFENRIKSAPTVFSFIKVPDGIPVFNYPYPPSPWQSNRVLGTASKIFTNREWDELNAVLGPKHKINLIIIGFDQNYEGLLDYQQAKFVGGKKNDLVISYIGDSNKPDSVKVFGWTESDICKVNIQNYIIDNGVNKDLLTYLPDEIKNNYKLKDWKQFDYIKVEPDSKYYYWFFGILTLTQSLLYFFFHQNNVDKGNYSDYDPTAIKILNS